MRNKVFHFLIFIITGVILITGCDDSWRRDRSSRKWNSQDPYSIPIEVRSKEYQKGNLIPNASFEDGSMSTSDTSGSEFTLKNWEIIGDGVSWTEISDSASITEGKYCLKISRAKSPESDTLGSGVLSDFIEVIPGNYDFHLSIKLSDIKSPDSRMGTKLFKSVNIRVQYYDEHKKPLSSMNRYPYTDTEIDNGFKGYGFSNFWYIDSMPWSTYRARSYNYPYSDGDIPDDCRFIKIFVGLQGNGTMWVDNLSYHYSKWNFSPKEKTDSLRELTYTPYDLLLPSPKEMEEKQIIKINEYTNPVIVSEINNNGIVSGIDLLKEQLGACGLTNNIPVIAASQYEKADSLYNLVIKISTIESDSVKAPQQGYTLKTQDAGHSDVISISGFDHEGTFYGIGTLIQLIDTAQNIIWGANIYDYPDFLGRSYLLSSWGDSSELQNDYDNLQKMSMLRFNKAYVGYGQTKNRKDWYNPSEIYIQGVRSIGKWYEKNGGGSLAIMINPYYHFEYEMYVPDMSDTLKYIWQHDEKGMQTLKAVFNIGMQSGATTIMLMGDDFVPHEKDYRKLYSLWTDEDKERHRTLAGAQIYMINYIYNWLKNEYPGTRMEFCPPWYLNEFIDKSRGSAEAYFDELMANIPQDVAIIWTGNTVRSLQIDEVDLYRYMKYSKRLPMLWDNTLYARGLEGIYGGYPSMYPEKAILCNLFEPFDIEVPHDFHLMNDGRHMYVNGSAGSELYKIKYATLAEFLWNTNSYNPELALWKVLVKWYGEENAALLIDINNSYFKILRYILMSEIKEEDPGKHDRSAEKEIEEFNTLMLELKKDNRCTKLAEEIENMELKLEERLSALQNEEDESDQDGNRQI
ncbi:MAG: hypothetical protein C0592_05760 [Marinilabiliales bacterium]|nr:MAG: hypothetical protein C0592_05760 [Marinilabiliales bacterium]